MSFCPIQMKSQDEDQNYPGISQLDWIDIVKSQPAAQILLSIVHLLLKSLITCFFVIINCDRILMIMQRTET